MTNQNYQELSMLLEKTTDKASELMAPDFEMESITGERLRLSDFRHRRHVVLVFNRGFT
jgi:peroxiredoxin